MPKVDEIESKLNAPSEAALKQVSDYIKSDPYYMAAPDVVETDEPADTMHLERTYFDTVTLDGYNGSVEIRMEHKTRKPDDKKPYKMTIKVAKVQGGKKKMAIDRLEASYRLEGPKPDLSVIDDPEVEKALEKTFDVRKIKDVKLLPMIRIMAQRKKYTYYPGGNKAAKVEFDSAVGIGHDFTGKKFDLFQIELESKEGDPALLETETEKLMKQFNFLALDTKSKPSPGFENLKTVMADKVVRDFARDNLDPKAFRVLNRIPGLKND